MSGRFGTLAMDAKSKKPAEPRDDLEHRGVTYHRSADGSHWAVINSKMHKGTENAIKKKIDKSLDKTWGPPARTDQNPVRKGLSERKLASIRGIF